MSVYPSNGIFILERKSVQSLLKGNGAWSGMNIAPQSLQCSVPSDGFVPGPGQEQQSSDVSPAVGGHKHLLLCLLRARLLDIIES